MSLYDKIQTTTEFIKTKIKNTPTTGIILGSGLGGLIDMIEKETEIHYSEIPNFPVSTVQGHDGKLVFGKIGNKQVILMAGRFHYYEGYSMEEVTFPVRVMKALGVDTVFVSNASGGTNPTFKIGDLMIIEDHINLFPEHPLSGPNDERLGVRFLDMSAAYDKGLIALGKEIAAEHGINIRTGVYTGLQGPTFETPAEYSWLHRNGGDAVGMSTVPEIIVARHGGMKVFGISVITDLGVTDVPVIITHEEVLEAANAAAPKMAGLVEAMIKRM
ncbi:purine-nucleoside phosphorylase [Flavipsychrobacter stenotrophus]|uniref:Purine nucleoside phosphorylase n=1 Tax=Flavipsychrobacter stenotrophus TaxID=2077091 RepID=A0A2S7T0M8_9BACT|nr:purine-nucleoside phosphorylase [Flavipsychrobacter stenotrophus]PQJ12514.1 purine-nucleoside phosphorylase [Flavipsychrobacter stenotrophus]